MLSLSSTLSGLHGGASFGAIGSDFKTLEKREDVISADVLDAWFPPAPTVVQKISDHLAWALKTSPPADCVGMIEAISVARSLPKSSLAVGSGSSSLIYLAFNHWLTNNSRVLLIQPIYSEYRYICENVVKCQVDCLSLTRSDRFQLVLDELVVRCTVNHYDLVVLVNPNNPTGVLQQRQPLVAALKKIPKRTRVWIDEAYIDYVDANNSIESFAADSENIFVCKSLSKCLALSGARAAYLAGPVEAVKEIRLLTPPWAVSLIAQIAAVEALSHPGYYAQRYSETRHLRHNLAVSLKTSVKGLTVTESPANWLLCYLPENAPSASSFCEKFQQHNLFLRNASTISPELGVSAVRIAVKDEVTNGRMLSLLADWESIVR